MKEIPDKSIDMILCDLPYGTTACKWDEIIPFDKLWLQYERIIKEGGAICLFGSEPFSSKLRMSNLKLYKYDWIWNKKLAGNGILAKRQPLKIHEIISVFNSKIYFPQKTKGKMRSKMTSGIKTSEINGGDGVRGCDEYKNDLYYPVSIQEFGIGNMRIGRLHPTQKPVELCEYLIKTYTNESETILDNCMGSGSIGVACVNLNRNFIGMELDEGYFNIAKERIEKYNKT
jgi:site-specific DNA-methyltransferase (adenine-specific)